LKAIVKEFNDAITEAVSVRDEIQSLFDDFEEKLDAENEKEKAKVLNGKISDKELVDSYIEYFKDTENKSDTIANQTEEEDESANYSDHFFENEPSKYKYLIRVKSDYFRQKFPDFDAMSQQKKDDIMAKEFESLTSILKGKSEKMAIFFNEYFEIEEMKDLVEIYPLKDVEDVKFVTEEDVDNDPALARRLSDT
jgi:hypothetical protein